MYGIYEPNMDIVVKNVDGATIIFSFLIAVAFCIGIIYLSNKISKRGNKRWNIMKTLRKALVGWLIPADSF